MSEAKSIRDFGIQRVLADATITPYEVRQSPTGAVQIYDKETAGASGAYFDSKTVGIYMFVKTAGINILKGGRVYWDHSANSATFRKVNDRDYYIGRAVEDANSAAVVVLVDSNANPPYDIDLMRDGFLTIPVGTQALGGFLPPQNRGGSLFMELTATNEAQKLDAFSVDRFAKGANAIAEFIVRVVDDGSGTVVDASIGLANATHATDASSITERLLFHLDANAVSILMESGDGTTTVALTDTTVDYSEGSAVANRFELWLDMRDPADVQAYIDGVNVLPATVFNIDALTGQLGLLVHLEKTASTDTYQLAIDRACVRFAEQ